MPAGINFRETKKGEGLSDSSPFLLHEVKKLYVEAKIEFKMTDK